MTPRWLSGTGRPQWWGAIAMLAIFFVGLATIPKGARHPSVLVTMVVYMSPMIFAMLLGAWGAMISNEREKERAAVVRDLREKSAEAFAKEVLTEMKQKFPEATEWMTKHPKAQFWVFPRN